MKRGVTSNKIIFILKSEQSLVLCCYTCEGQIRSQRYTWGGLYPKVSFKPYGGKSQGSEQNQFPKMHTGKQRDSTIRKF